MRRPALLSVSPRSAAAGFSLVEVVLALAIVAVAFVGVLGLMPAGLEASQRAQEATVVANILDSLHQRLRGEPMTDKKAEAVSFSPALFDVEGGYIPPNAPPERKRQAYYRAELTVNQWREQPAYAKSLRAVAVTLQWPVSPATGEARPDREPQVEVSFPVSALTGPDWEVIANPPERTDKFWPKIEF